MGRLLASFPWLHVPLVRGVDLFLSDQYRLVYRLTCGGLMAVWIALSACLLGVVPPRTPPVSTDEKVSQLQQAATQKDNEKLAQLCGESGGRDLREAQAWAASSGFVCATPAGPAVRWPLVIAMGVWVGGVLSVFLVAASGYLLLWRGLRDYIGIHRAYVRLYGSGHFADRRPPEVRTGS